MSRAWEDLCIPKLLFGSIYHSKPYWTRTISPRYEGSCIAWYTTNPKMWDPCHWWPNGIKLKKGTTYQTNTIYYITPCKSTYPCKTIIINIIIKMIRSYLKSVQGLARCPPVGSLKVTYSTIHDGIKNSSTSAWHAWLIMYHMCSHGPPSLHILSSSSSSDTHIHTKSVIF